MRLLYSKKFIDNIKSILLVKTKLLDDLVYFDERNITTKSPKWKFWQHSNKTTYPKGIYYKLDPLRSTTGHNTIIKNKRVWLKSKLNIISLNEKEIQINYNSDKEALKVMKDFQSRLKGNIVVL